MTYSEIKNLRKSYGISQIKLAEASGFSPARISSWERKKSIPSECDINIVKKAIDDIIFKFFMLQR